MAELSYGQLDAYRRHCAELLRYFGQRKTVGHRDSFQISETCFLAPDAVADFSTALAIANNTVNALPDDPAYLFARGAVLYRAGRIEEAIADLDRSHILLKEPTFHTPFMMLRRAQVCSFLAMAHHRLGHGEEAKRWFDKMVEQADAAMEEHRSGKVSFYWNIRAPMKLLRPEAAQLLGISEKPAGQDVSVNKSPSASLIRPRE
jgi:tetratricopeptide (TPR) repeat protein